MCFKIAREGPSGPVPVDRSVTRSATRTPAYEEAPSALRPFFVQRRRGRQRAIPNESENDDDYVIPRSHRQDQSRDNIIYSEREYDGEGDESVNDQSDRSQRSVDTHRSSQTRSRDSLSSGRRGSYLSVGSLGSRSPNFSSSSSSAHSDPSDGKYAGGGDEAPVLRRLPTSNAGSRRVDPSRNSLGTGPPGDSNTFMGRKLKESQHYQISAIQEAMLAMQQQNQLMQQ